jgi:hypothetical protein
MSASLKWIVLPVHVDVVINTLLGQRAIKIQIILLVLDFCASLLT